VATGRRRRLIPASRKSRAGRKGGEARHRSGRNLIGGVGEVGGSPTKLSAVARIEWGGAPMRGRSWKGHRGGPARGGARGCDGRAKLWPEEAALGGAEAGCERKTKVKKGEFIGGTLSHPGSRKLNRSLHTCAQDVQITHTANNMVNRYNISLNYKLESLQNDPWVQKKYYRVAQKSKHMCVFHSHNRRRGRPSLYLLAPTGTLGWTPAFCST
jgi:hypothetical protein